MENSESMKYVKQYIINVYGDATLQKKERLREFVGIFRKIIGGKRGKILSFSSKKKAAKRKKVMH